mgnify:CR=1 FL=1
MPRKAKKRRVYRTKEETKERKRLKQKQRQRQEQNVNIKVGSSGSSSQQIPTVISNTHYVPQQQNNDNLLAFLMKSFGNRQEQPVIKELPKTFRNMSVGEDVPIQNLVEQVQRPISPNTMWDNMSDITHSNSDFTSLKISEDTPSIQEGFETILPKPKLKRTQNNEDRIKEKMETDQMAMEDANVLKGRNSPIIEEGEGLITIVPKKRISNKKKQQMEDINALIERPQQEQIITEATKQNKRDTQKQRLIRDINTLIPDEIERNIKIYLYIQQMKNKKSYQRFNKDDLIDLLSYLTKK